MTEWGAAEKSPEPSPDDVFATSSPVCKSQKQTAPSPEPEYTYLPPVVEGGEK